jgi:tetratricopeptide (TPR) repeat protein
MLDRIPEHAWLLVGIATAAFGPLRYLYRYVTQSPRGHDITQPPGDFGWRTRPLLFRNLGALILLLAAAWFVSTPTAEKFFSGYSRSAGSDDDAAIYYPPSPFGAPTYLPSAVGLHEKALFEQQTGDAQAALDLLTQALRENPNDAWALRMQADIYWQLGEHEKSRDDEDRLYQIEIEANTPGRYSPPPGR